MLTRKIKNAKDLTDGSLIYFKGHAQATYMSDGSTVEDAIKASKKVDLTGYATEEFVNYKTNELQILLDEHYVTTNILNESLPNLDNYVTNTTFNQTISAVFNNVNSKQNTIIDLASIREGAALGATAVQPEAISDMVTKTELDKVLEDINAALEARIAELESKLLELNDVVVNDLILFKIGHPYYVDGDSAAHFNYITYKSEKDMTWESWISSKYNTKGFTIVNTNIVLGDYKLHYINSDNVHSINVIQKNESYYLG